MSLITKKNILLTGAGFSANFGGLLAREMWSKILSNPKMDAIPQIREILKKDFDFESVYSSVKNSGVHTQGDKEIFQEIVLESYCLMDNYLKEYSQSSYDKSGMHFGNFRNWLDVFKGAGEEVGAHFTLNQDLLIERETRIVPLGLGTSGNGVYIEKITSATRQIDHRVEVKLPNEASLEEFKTTYLSSNGNFCYIKLHGSIGWLSHDGQSQLILGTNKLEDIKKEPLLKWYFDLFNEAISRSGVRLFVIGYSFRDDHVNDLIMRAINEYNLEIYIISPEHPESLKNRLEGKKDSCSGYEVLPTNKIWEAVYGYFPYSLREIFPSHQTGTGVYFDIQRNLLK